MLSSPALASHSVQHPRSRSIFRAMFQLPASESLLLLACHDMLSRTCIEARNLMSVLTACCTVFTCVYPPVTRVIIFVKISSLPVPPTPISRPPTPTSLWPLSTPPVLTTPPHLRPGRPSSPFGLGVPQPPVLAALPQMVAAPRQGTARWLVWYFFLFCLPLM